MDDDIKYGVWGQRGRAGTGLEAGLGFMYCLFKEPFLTVMPV